MGPVVEVIDEVVRRESECLQRRSEELRARYDALAERFPSAAKLEPEIAAVERADQRLLAALADADREAWLQRASDEILASFSDEESRQELRWAPERDAFVAGSASLRPSRSASSEEVGAGCLVEKLLDASRDPAIVSYPIIFTHQVEEAYRSITHAVLWAVVASAARQVVAAKAALEAVVLTSQTTSIEVDSLRLEKEAIPTAEALGFSPRGDLHRRMEEFSQTDPDAHVICWVTEREQAPREERFLREQGGALVKMDVDRELRRIREEKRPRSEVVRKRRNLFVDPVAPVTTDRFFATEEDLEAALVETLKERIEEGYRLVYERLNGPKGPRERGLRPVKTSGT